MASKSGKSKSGELARIYSAGRLLGEKLQHQLQSSPVVDRLHDLADDYSDWIKIGMELSEEHAPRTCALLRGISASTEIPYKKLFAGWCEEIYFIDAADKTKLKDTGCSDIILKDSKNIIIAHTNDGDPGDTGRLIKLGVPGLPAIIAVFSRGIPSVACNSAGLVLSGNQLDANDMHPGIPRSILYMEACWSTNIEQARKILLNPHRSSSLNHVLADQSGLAVNIEASAGDEAVATLGDGISAHTNHFLWLVNREGRAGRPLQSSQDRLRRALDEGDALGSNRTLRAVIRLLKSHGRGGLCRHNSAGADTYFSIIFLPQQGVFLYGPGFPCQTKYRAYKFAERVSK